MCPRSSQAWSSPSFSTKETRAHLIYHMSSYTQTFDHFWLVGGVKFQFTYRVSLVSTIGGYLDRGIHSYNLSDTLKLLTAYSLSKLSCLHVLKGIVFFSRAFSVMHFPTLAHEWSVYLQNRFFFQLSQF